ncbi:MAG: hypothetical protein AAF468_04030 [Pseudomonadota bacterium]
MALFLYKPHIMNAAGQITSPDVIADRLWLDGRKPVHQLTAEYSFQVDGSMDVRAAYALMALGGGVSIAPALVLGDGRVTVSRNAWRLNNLEPHMGEVTLNGAAFPNDPLDIIAQAGGKGLELPRGVMAIAVGGSAKCAILADPKSERVIDHRPALNAVDEDPWGSDRPDPRYTVGPTQKEVTHYL